MPLQAIESHRLYRQIATQLGLLIEQGEFGPGQRLPSERDLASQLNVSRQSVREALIALEIVGKVVIRVGSGVYVSESPAPSPVSADEEEGQGPFELLRARWLVEGEIASEAARKGRPEQIQAVRAAFEEMQRREREPRSVDRLDREFHLSIAAAAQNSALVSLVRDLWDRGRGTIWKRMEHHFQTPALRAATSRDHRAIVTALESRDARGARSAMRRHLARVEREFNSGWGQMKGQRHREPAAAKKEQKARRPSKVMSRVRA